MSVLLALIGPLGGLGLLALGYWLGRRGPALPDPLADYRAHQRRKGDT